jgi:hypothetical protein
MDNGGGMVILNDSVSDILEGYSEYDPFFDFRLLEKLIVELVGSKDRSILMAVETAPNMEVKTKVRATDWAQEITKKGIKLTAQTEEFQKNLKDILEGKITVKEVNNKIRDVINNSKHGNRNCWRDLFEYFGCDRHIKFRKSKCKRTYT